MHDSPVALAAWILERRRNWSDNDGDVEQAFSRKFLLDLVSLYWYTDGFLGSARYYFHSFRRPWRPTQPGRAVQVPVGVSVFPRELVFTPRATAEENLHLRSLAEHPRGGHFAPPSAGGLVRGRPWVLPADLVVGPSTATGRPPSANAARYAHRVGPAGAPLRGIRDDNSCAACHTCGLHDKLHTSCGRPEGRVSAWVRWRSRRMVSPPSASRV
jgi:hypothetical protein